MKPSPFRVSQEYLKQASKSLIIVDVQPAYERNTPFDVGEMVEWASENYSRVLILWNGPSLGYVNKRGLISFYFEKTAEYLGDWDAADDMVSDLVDSAKFFEKGYGFFRGMMDHCYLRKDIIKLVKYMLANKLQDLRVLSEEQVEYLGIPGLIFEELEDYGFGIPEELASVLKKWNRSDIVGGDKNECLAEVEILGEAMGLSFNQKKRFIY